MSDPQRMATVGVPGERPDECCGAFVRVTGDELQSIRNGGVVFKNTYPDGNGWVDARARCDAPAEVREIANERFGDEPVTYRRVSMGVCSRCSSLEQYVRRIRKESKGTSR